MPARRTSQQAPNNRQTMNNLKMSRTLESTAFEAVAAIILLTALITACLRPCVLPLGVTLLTWAIMSAATVLLLVIAYRPNSDLINIPVRRNPENLEQMVLVGRLMRVLAVLCALINGAFICSALSNHDPSGTFMATAAGVAMMVAIAYYTHRIRQAGKRMGK